MYFLVLYKNKQSSKKKKKLPLTPGAYLPNLRPQKVVYIYIYIQKTGTLQC